MSEKIKIIDIAFNGYGVGQLKNGKIVFVPFTGLDEEVEITNIKNKSNYAIADLVCILNKSPYRITPACKYYTICGGCQYMHILYDKEIEYKKKQLKDILIRIGKLNPELEIKVIKSDKELFYRNSLSLQNQSNKLGFYLHDNTSIENIDKCMLSQDILNNFILNNRNDILKIKEKKITLKTDGQKISFKENNNILKKVIEKNDFYFDYKNFFQVNDYILSQIISVISNDLKLENNSKCLFDLYSGIGIYSICFNKYFDKIIGIEENEHSINFANKNKKDIEKIIFFASKAEDTFFELYKKYKEKENIIIINPPRIGIHKNIIKALKVLDNLTKIIYISCNPATLARDISQIISSNKFSVEKIFLFDMFSRTKFFETVVFLKKCN